MTAQERNYLVDYDIPARPGYESPRVTFYHTKKKLMAEAMRQDNSIRVLFSSYSVLVCNNASLARDLSKLAREFEASSTHCYELGGLEEIQEWPS